jgi:hypothetical protein
LPTPERRNGFAARRGVQCPIAACSGGQAVEVAFVDAGIGMDIGIAMP